MNKDWIEITVYTNPNSIEDLSGFLFQLQPEGIEEKEDCFKIFFNGNKWDAQLKNELTKI